nr:hypothetical protein [Paracoccus saliphilus]
MISIKICLKLGFESVIPMTGRIIGQNRKAWALSPHIDTGADSRDI